MKTTAIRLHPGDDLKVSIVAWTKANRIKAGCVIGCVGSLAKANVRLANAAEATAAEGFFEILTLSGTLSPDGAHLHISFSDETGAVRGGHLCDGSVVYTTAEIVIGILEGLQFGRSYDSRTGFAELVIKPD